MTWATAYQKKLISPDHLAKKISEIRSQGRTIATLNGSFDLLHAGHLHIIYEASRQADCLIMALNTDRSIQEYKSPKRPIITLDDRLKLLAALEFVDYLTWFDETDPRQLLAKIKPDVHVNGSEYGDNCVEAETVKQGGGKLHLVSLVPGLSTSAIVRKIQKDLECAG